jgi:hypothetical protein
MNAVRRHYALVLIGGAAVLATAIGFSTITTGLLFAAHPFLAALRASGLGLMASGFTLWLSLCRQQGGKPTLNTLFDFLNASGIFLLVLGTLFFGRAFTPVLLWGGLGLSGSGLLIGLLAMVVDPCYPCKIAVRWPEGGEEHPNPFVPALELHRPQGYAVAPQDLTVIEGIGPRIQNILNQAGIINYKDIVVRTPEELSDLLREYHLHAPISPRTWPEQAKLAAEGNWGALRQMQEQLTGGRARG